MVGAGASSEVGLPIGTDLKKKISERLNISYEFGRILSGDTDIANLIMRQGSEAQKYHHAGIQIREAMPQAISIDNYLDAHQSDRAVVECGKWAIAKSILEAEVLSQLAVGSDLRLKHDDLSKTWFSAFFQLLTQDVPRERVSRIFDSIEFITFNYDRCIEHYLFHALSSYYRLNEHETIELMSRLRIAHPYGKVGELPWQQGNMGVPFGETYLIDKLSEIANRIRTFTERVEEEKVLSQIRTTVANSEVIVFLGFGFHSQNMALLSPGRTGQTKEAFATAANMSENDRDVVGQRILELIHKHPRQVEPRVEALTCAEFMSHFWLSLSNI